MLNRLLLHITAFSLLFLPVMGGSSAPAAAAGKLELTLPATWNPDTAPAEHKQVIQQIKGRLKNDNSLRVTVTGHTDTLGAASENSAIGYYYASRVADHLSTKYGIAEERIDILSQGEAETVVKSGGFNQQRKNRRVIVSLVKPSVIRVATAKQPQRNRSGKNVIILEPAPGTVDRSYQVVKAVVGKSKTALLTINGLSSLVTVQDSRIEAEAVLDRGENSIEVMAWDESGAFGKDQVEVTYVPPPPEIEIYKPADGELYNTTHSPVVHVTGKILAKTPLKESFLFLNGSARRIAVNEQGEFNQAIVLIRRTNELRVEALDIYNKTATSPDITVNTMNLAPKDVVVFLNWDKPDVDLDLHVKGPGNTHTYYGALDPYESREAIPFAGLDLDDKDGYGPEVFSMLDGLDGRYQIEAQFQYSLDREESMATVTVILHPADPARRITRMFGPRKMAPGSLSDWKVTEINMPEGTFTDRTE
jgi:uncharacterized protein YfaP (DUF2135 family)